MITDEQIRDTFRKQLSYEFHCEPEDFTKQENVITTPVLHEERRMFSDKPFFLQMATFGGNTVISADERIHPWLNEWMKDKSGFWLFEQHNYYYLERKLREYGQKMSLTHHMFLPKAELLDLKTDLEVKWLEPEDISAFYGREEFSNALCDRYRPERPDVLAVIALDGDKIMGMAGCSADTPKLWQIGIDVLPEYRCQGIARILVSLLRDEVFKRGAIPYYGTSLSNLASWKTALSGGFVPAWVECESREAEDEVFAK